MKVKRGGGGGGLNLDYTVVWQETETKQVNVQFCITSTMSRGIIMMG